MKLQIRSRGGFVFFCAMIAQLSSCGSIDTVNDTDIKPEAIEGRNADGTDSKIFGAYDVSFDAETEKYSVSSVLRLGGSTGTGLRLSQPNRIEWNSQPLTMNDGDSGWKIYTTFYFLNLSAPFQETHLFQWITGNKQRTNRVTLQAVTAKKLESTKIKAGEELIISWAGADVVKVSTKQSETTDEVFLSMSLVTPESLNSEELEGFERLPSEEAEPQKLRKFLSIPSDADNNKVFRLKSDISKDLEPGRWKLRAIRKWSSTPKEGHGAGGRLKGVYRDIQQEINISPAE